jgi:hypothetical protein
MRMVDVERRYVLSADGCYVYDSWDCYREVLRPITKRTGNGALIAIPSSVQRAVHTCARFNREHDEWMRDGCLV